jgi:hypothetical protein
MQASNIAGIRPFPTITQSLTEQNAIGSLRATP